MHIEEFKHYLHKISDIEFSERNTEIQRCVISTKNDLASRGVLNSSITLQKLSIFFEKEFAVRCDFISSFCIKQIGKIDMVDNVEPVSTIKEIYQLIALKCREEIIELYKGSVSAIAGCLQSNFPDEIEEKLIGATQSRIQKNNLYVEFESKAFFSAKADSKSMFLLAPNFYGIGIDLRELWNRVFKA